MSTNDPAAALDAFEAELADPVTAPRSDRELAARVQQALLTAPPPAPRVYVPDAEAPITPGVRDEQIGGPLSGLGPEASALSARARAVVASSTSLVAESAAAASGLAALVQPLAARVAALRSLSGSSGLAWMRVSDRFLDLSGVDAGSSQGVVVHAVGGSGVALAPGAEQDLTSSVASLTLLRKAGDVGLPGNNLEIATLQGDPSAQTPAAGSGSALSSDKARAGASGGVGAEPTVTYVGGSDLHADVSAQLSDSDHVYFDYEAVYVPPEQKCVRRGTAYVHDPSGSQVSVPDVTHNYGWKATVTQADGSSASAPVAYLSGPPGGGPLGALRLSESIDFGTPAPINQMEITVRSQGGLWPDIDGVRVSLDRSTWFDMTCQGAATSWQGNAASASWSTTAASAGGATNAASGGGSQGTSLWSIPSWVQDRAETGTPLFRYAVIDFSQPDAYECAAGVGHPYYVEVTQKQNSSSALFGLIKSSSNETDSVRLPTADRLVDVTAGSSQTVKSSDGAALGSLLGAAASLLPSSALGTAANRDASLVGGAGAVVTGVVTGLFGSRTHKTTVLQAGEYTDVFQGFRQCVSVGRVRPLSRTFPTDSPGQVVTSDRSFSQAFSTVRLLVDQRVPDGTSITYDVSADGGQTWTPVVPFDLGQPAAPYASSPGFQTVALDGPKTSVRVRATLSTSAAHVTPVLLGYTLEALPA